MGSINNYPVIVKSYELALWCIKKIATFPKNHRYTLGETVQTELIGLLMHLTEAIYSKDKVGLLKRANLNMGTSKNIDCFTSFAMTNPVIARLCKGRSNPKYSF